MRLYTNLVAIVLSSLALLCGKTKAVDIVDTNDRSVVLTVFPNSGNLRYGCPSKTDFVIDRQAYAIGYLTNYYQSAWVCYGLTRSNILNRTVKRTNDFRPDPLLGKYSAVLADYRRSGFDRGHLCPAADTSWSSNAVSESFYMSNMSPQVGGFNRGIWKDLEHWVRAAAVSLTNIYVYTGPIFTTNLMLGVIGPHKIIVPDAYYKVVLDENEPKRAIGFVLPNQSNTNSYWKYVRSVREVESLTGLDFFSNMSSNTQESIETTVVTNHWTHFNLP